MTETPETLRERVNVSIAKYGLYVGTDDGSTLSDIRQLNRLVLDVAAAWEADRTDRDALREDMALAVEIAQAHDLDLLASIESTKAIRASLPPEENEP